MKKRQLKNLSEKLKAIWIITGGIYFLTRFFVINPEFEKIISYLSGTGIILGGIGLYFEAKSK